MHRTLETVNMNTKILLFLAFLVIFSDYGDGKLQTCGASMVLWAEEEIFAVGNPLPVYYKDHVLLTREVTWFWVNSRQHGLKYKLQSDSACTTTEFENLHIHFNAEGCVYDFHALKPAATEDCRCTYKKPDRMENRIGVSADTGNCTVYISFHQPANESLLLPLLVSKSELKRSMENVKDKKIAYDVLMPRVYPFSPKKEADRDGKSKLIAKIAIGAGCAVLIIAIICVVLLLGHKQIRKCFKNCMCCKKKQPPPPTPTPSATPIYAPAPVSTVKTGTSIGTGG